MAELATGAVPFPDLVISRNLSNAPEEYVQNSPTAVVARQLAARGVRLSAGERVQLVLTDRRSPLPDLRACALSLMDGRAETYDVEAYTDLLRRARDTLTFRVEQKSRAVSSRQLTLPF